MTQAVPFPPAASGWSSRCRRNPNVASSLNLARATGGTWTGQGTNLSIDGQWDIDVVVQQAATAVDVSLRLRTRLPPERITVSRQPGQQALYTIQLGHGRSLQAYLQQLAPGHGLVHFTFFEASGKEEPITSAKAAAVTPAGADQPLKLTRLAQRALRSEPERDTRAVDLPHRRPPGRRPAAVRVLLPDHPAVTLCQRVPAHAQARHGGGLTPAVPVTRNGLPFKVDRPFSPGSGSDASAQDVPCAGRVRFRPGHDQLWRLEVGHVAGQLPNATVHTAQPVAPLHQPPRR